LGFEAQEEKVIELMIKRRANKRAGALVIVWFLQRASEQGRCQVEVHISDSLAT
jgi:hypothetical protein